MLQQNDGVTYHDCKHNNCTSEMRSKYRDTIVFQSQYQDLTGVYWMETYHNIQSSSGVISVNRQTGRKINYQNKVLGKCFLYFKRYVDKIKVVSNL